MISQALDEELIFVCDAGMSNASSIIVSGLTLLATVGCAQSPREALPQVLSAPVVYGTDDREDYFELGGEGPGDLIQKSTVALVDPRYIDLSDPDNVVPDTVSLGDYLELCPDERYFSQPSMASCSGTLIDDDLVLTAAHCVDAEVCANWYFVFGFYMNSSAELNRMTAADVYTCAEIVVAEYTEDENEPTWHDYAIVRLDRPVDSARIPVVVEMDPTTVGVGDPITAIGFGNGIPAKAHRGKVLRSTVPWGYFIGTTDTFSGNSGSGTYNADNELIGVFVRGTQADYVQKARGCWVVNNVNEDEGTQEYDYASKAILDLCERDIRSERLCGQDDPEPTPDPGAEPTPETEAELSPEPSVEDSGAEIAENPDSDNPMSPATDKSSEGCLMSDTTAVSWISMLLVCMRKRRVRFAR